MMWGIIGEILGKRQQIILQENQRVNPIRWKPRHQVKSLLSNLLRNRLRSLPIIQLPVPPLNQVPCPPSNPRLSLPLIPLLSLPLIPLLSLPLIPLPLLPPLQLLSLPLIPPFSRVLNLYFSHRGSPRFTPLPLQPLALLNTSLTSLPPSPSTTQLPLAIIASISFKHQMVLRFA